MENNLQSENINLDLSPNKNLITSLQNYSDILSTQDLFTYHYYKAIPLIAADRIELNEKENKIFTIIKEVLKKNGRKTVCRVAGGWVRDKLLGRKNDDIDIALDDMSGQELAKMINDELYPGEEKFGVIGKNSEGSKHLETATMKICDSFVDFVNLRSETYTEHSRVPVIEIGTPEEDAKRRDITINSMFYNINTGLIEDFLGNGINDLRNGYIRTPLEPEITFADDPLRILRVIRFAVRFQFELDPSIEKAAKKENIKEALYMKISNERIAKELSLMLEGNKPQCALYLLFKFNLMDAVMKLPLGNENLKLTMQAEIVKAMNLVLLGGVIIEKKHQNNNSLFFNKYLFNTNDQDFKESKKLFFLALMSLPFKDYSNKIGKEIIKGNVSIIRDSLKLPNEYIREISVLHENIDQLIDYVNSNLNNFDRLNSGRIIRKVKSTYIHKLTLLSICYEYAVKIDHTNSGGEILPYVNLSVLDSIIEKYQNWYFFLEKENLLNIDTLEPLVKGDKMVELFGVRGKDIGVLLEYLIESQITNSNLTKEDAIELLRNKRDELGLLDNTDNKGGNKKKKK